MTRLGCFACIGLAVGALTAWPAAATPLDWGLRLSRQTSWSQQDFSGENQGFSTHVGLLDAAGWELAGDVRFTHRFSIEAGWSQLEWNAQAYTIAPSEHLDGTTPVFHGQVTSNTYNLAAFWHPLSTYHFDGYVGPVAGWTTYHLGLGWPAHNGDLSYGVKLGFQYAIADTPVRLGVEVRRLEIAHSRVDDRDIYGSFAAHSAAFTIGYRFRH